MHTFFYPPYPGLAYTVAVTKSVPPPVFIIRVHSKGPLRLIMWLRNENLTPSQVKSNPICNLVRYFSLRVFSISGRRVLKEAIWMTDDQKVLRTYV